MRASFVPPASNARNFTAPYTFVEYPKHVTLADGSFIVVHNADEEAAAAPSERDALMAEARELGLNPHHKAGVEKLREMIAEKRNA